MLCMCVAIHKAKALVNDSQKHPERITTESVDTEITDRSEFNLCFPNNALLGLLAFAMYLLTDLYD